MAIDIKVRDACTGARAQARSQARARQAHAWAKTNTIFLFWSEKRAPLDSALPQGHQNSV